MPVSSAFYERVEGAQGVLLRLTGDWVMDHARVIKDACRTLAAERPASINATDIGRMDLWGALQLRALISASNVPVMLNARQEKLFAFMDRQKAAPPQREPKPYLVSFFETIGEFFWNGARTAYGILSFIGEISIRIFKNVAHPSSFRIHSIVRHIQETGLQALPIIGLLAILISMVIAYQAATQLQKFGANIFTIDLTVISLLREMGVLITAIMVAGRSGSAFAAEIGVMKLREEVDALKTMGMDPIEVLVVPRLIAMMITLPILAFLADIIGLMGGAVISIALLDIPFYQYVDRVDMVATPTMFFVGLIKAPVFAFIITVIGAYQGMNVTGSAESVGRLTTMAVVQSIFLVIMADALFSIVFSKMGI